MIKILDKYIIRNFAKTFMFMVAALSLVTVISESLQLINLYMKHKAPFNLILLHQISNIPENLMQALPIATLLAVLFSFSNLSQKNEITVIKAAGINIWRIITIFLITGFIIGMGDFAVRETIVPKTSLYNEKIKKEKIEKEKIIIQTDYYNQIVALPDNTRITIGHLDTKAGIMKDVVMEKYNDAFVIGKLILAKEARWENNSWVFKNGVIRNFNIKPLSDIRNFDSKPWDEMYFKDYNVYVHITPKNLTVKTRNVRLEAMSVREFNKHINQLKTFGQDVVKAKIILNMRFASMFSHVVVMMIAIPFAVGIGKRLNKMVSFILAVCAAFAYWSVQAIARSLGENLILSPPIAAWLPNIIFLAIGIYFLIKVKK
ncbi:LPS export ABC transporter permease LptG [Endomicrobiia bacterium]|nr:LPS export ABC transporter permease LptG [Endomicrobiia bacterium]